MRNLQCWTTPSTIQLLLKARFIWQFRVWCLPQKASRVWFEEVSSNKQHIKTTNSTCLFAMPFMASCVLFWRHFDRSTSIWIV